MGTQIMQPNLMTEIYCLSLTAQGCVILQMVMGAVRNNLNRTFAEPCILHETFALWEEFPVTQWHAACAIILSGLECETH